MGERFPVEDLPGEDPFEDQEGLDEVGPIDIVLSPAIAESLRRVTVSHGELVVHQVAEALRQHALLLEPSKVTSGVLCRMALYDGSGLKGFDGPRIDERWLVDAMRNEMEQDLEDERGAVPLATPVETRFEYLAETLGMPMELARKACVTINQLDSHPRTAFFEVALMRCPIEEVAEKNGESAGHWWEALGAAAHSLTEQAWTIDIARLQSKTKVEPFDLRGGVGG